ncbi:prephenate dehydrogenase/arogenate dehydrogenase family protein [Candidatus Azambacteria bacterium]|nr:prephenate dehydrogenase/arogenate dehydrogenase family protein [Candidatus Azambacteria bacterium]
MRKKILVLDTIAKWYEEALAFIQRRDWTEAKAVANLGPNVKIAAITPKTAAEEYGLKVLAKALQDVLDNKMTPVLLQKEAMVRQIIVGIIGIDGGFGQMFNGLLEQIGYQVIGSDKKNPARLSNAEVVEQSDMVIFAVPTDDMLEVIHSALPYVQEDQLLMDITSIKVHPVEAMLKSEAQVVGLHPMFRPDMPFDGQTVVACPARLTVPHWITFVASMLTAMQAQIQLRTAAEHDVYMMPIQVTPHSSTLTNALLIMVAGLSVSKILSFASPFYRVMLSLMGRLLSQDPDLYVSIIIENPETLKMLEQRVKIEKYMIQMIHEKNRAGLKNLFVQAKTHFGPDAITEANEVFKKILPALIPDERLGKSGAGLDKK